MFRTFTLALSVLFIIIIIIKQTHKHNKKPVLNADCDSHNTTIYT